MKNKKIQYCDYFYELDKIGKYLYLHGIYFGFPKCCIKNFIFNVHTGQNKINKNESNKNKIENKFYGTGYIPCDLCIEKDYTELLNQINRNRISSGCLTDEIDYCIEYKTAVSSGKINESDVKFVLSEYKKLYEEIDESAIIF